MRRLDLTIFVLGGKRVDFFFPKSSFQNAVKKKHFLRALFFCRATPHMEGGRRRLDGDDDDDDDDEMCDQKRSRVARWALEEVRRRFRFALGAFSLRQKHFKKQLTPKTHLSLSLSPSCVSVLFFSRAVVPVFLPSVRERGGRGTGKMPAAEKQR